MTVKNGYLLLTRDTDRPSDQRIWAKASSVELILEQPYGCLVTMTSGECFKVRELAPAIFQMFEEIWQWPEPASVQTV